MAEDTLDPHEAQLLERHVVDETNRALRIGGLCSSAVGVVGGAGIALFMALTGDRNLAGPCGFAFMGGIASLALWWTAKTKRLHGRNSYVVMMPFVSLPTLIFLSSHVLYPAGAATWITGPFSYLYLFVVVVSGFVLDPKLTLVCTLFASAQYTIVQMLARPVLMQIQAPDAILYQDLTEPFIYANKTMMLLATGAATAGIARVARRLLFTVLHEQREKELIGRLFGEYVSPEVKQHIVEQKGRVVGERREVVILFSDLRGFTTYSEGKAPEEVMLRLNEYFERMVRAVEKQGGVVDKFIGDAVMAVFGGLLELDNAQDSAVRAAVEMRAELRALNAEWAALNIPAFDNGIGIHVGPVIQGPLGSTSRKEFTVIGDAVNTASRLESVTKEKGRHILISHEVFRRLSSTEQARFSEVGEVTVKGKREALRLYGCD